MTSPLSIGIIAVIREVQYAAFCVVRVALSPLRFAGESPGRVVVYADQLRLPAPTRTHTRFPLHALTERGVHRHALTRTVLLARK